MSQQKRFRIEGEQRGAEAPAVHGLPSAFPRMRTMQATAAVDAAVERMESETMKGVVRAGAALPRVNEELAAVAADVNRGVHAILAVIEEIDATIHRFKRTQQIAPEAAEVLADKALAVFQACDFQDLAGQRIQGVIRQIKELDRKIKVLQSSCGLADTAPEAAPPRVEIDSEAGWAQQLENGPRLQSDEGHLTQAQIDLIMAS